MVWRVLGVGLLLAALGAAGGYAVGMRDESSPVASGVPVPVPAYSPAVPTPTQPTIVRDPDAPPLAVDLPRHPVRLPYPIKPLRLAVPDGWVRTENDGVFQWKNPQVPPSFTYLLRVTPLVGSTVDVGVAVQNRINGFQSAQTNGGLSAFTVESTSGDTLTANYIENHHLRLTIERYVALGGTSAYADVSVTGREVDRDGLVDLLNRTCDSLSIPAPKAPPTSTPPPVSTPDDTPGAG